MLKLFIICFIGNCLKLVINGILNYVFCVYKFVDGCLKSYYFSDKIYNCKYLF